MLELQVSAQKGGWLVLDYRVGFHVKTLSKMIWQKVDYAHRDSELTGYQGYLMGFLVCEGRKRDIFQRDVEKSMEISRASVTSVLQLMEKNGMIRRESVDYDARLKKIVVTEKGLACWKHNVELLDQIEITLRKGVSEQELAIFKSVLERMKCNLGQTEEKKE